MDAGLSGGNTHHRGLSQAEPDEHLYLRERFAGRFRREIPLPHGVRESGFEAELDEGLLEIVVRKLRRGVGGPRQIKSKGTGSS